MIGYYSECRNEKFMGGRGTVADANTAENSFVENWLTASSKEPRLASVL